MSEVLVHVTRGSFIESRHVGNLVVVNREGRLLYSIGDPHHFTFWRSAAKPFQAIPLVEGGGMEKFNFSGEELAIMTSSHGGEEKHMKAVRTILNKINKSEADLDCGIAAPMHSKSAAQLLRSGQSFMSVTNACSGKHAAMLTLAALLDLPMENYINPQHKIQQIMLDTIAQSCNMSTKDVVVAIDGCGVPVYGMSIDKMAMAYAKLSKPEGIVDDKRAIALRKILLAMTNHPYYVAGTDRLDTILMEVTKGKLVAKLGAESVYCIGIVDEGIGICLKIDDGGYRAIDPVIIEILKELNILTNSELNQLKAHWKPQLKNHRQDLIGELKPVFKLKKH